MNETAHYMYFCDIEIKDKGLMPLYMHSSSNSFKILENQKPLNSENKLEAFFEAKPVPHCHITKTFKEAEELGLVLESTVYFILPLQKLQE